jgi:hypothetical protein
MLIPTFQKKSPLTAADLNLLGDTVRRARVLPGVGIKLTETLNGTVVSLKPTRSFGGGGESEKHPFQIATFAKTDSSGEVTGYECTVSPGTLNNLLPTNLFEDNAPTRHSYPKDSIQHVILTGLSNGKQFTSCELSVRAQPPPAQPPTLFGLPDEVEILLGVVYNGAIYQIVKTRLELVGKQLFLKDRDQPAQPGQLPYEAYFVWAA